MLPKTVSAPNHLGKRLDPHLPTPKRAMPKCRGRQTKWVFPNIEWQPTVLEKNSGVKSEFTCILDHLQRRVNLHGWFSPVSQPWQQKTSMGWKSLLGEHLCIIYHRCDFIGLSLLLDFWGHLKQDVCVAFGNTLWLFQKKHRRWHCHPVVGDAEEIRLVQKYHVFQAFV